MYIRPAGNAYGDRDARISARTSCALPMVISAPKPSPRFGHSWASAAAPNAPIAPADPAPSDRRRKSRRLTDRGGAGRRAGVPAVLSLTLIDSSQLEEEPVDPRPDPV